MIYKIAICCLSVIPLFSIEQVHLATPILSKENIMGTGVGVRPFRKTGVRIEAEYVEDKLIIHNYGYGGSGLTLSFGGAKEVLDILDNLQLPSKTVAILGAGVVGLATAYDLLERGYEVQLYANEWSPNLTSNIAAGIWSPLLFPKDLPEDKKQLHLRMQAHAEGRFLKSVGDDPEFAGVRLICAYSFKTEASQESDRTKQREEIFAHFDSGVIKSGRRIYELGIDGQLFMNDLCLKVKENGAVFSQMHFESLEDILNLEEAVIINCTSMGSMQLFNDQEFMPVRGHLVYFKPQADIDYLYFHNVDNADDSNLFFVSVYPWSDRMILGGVYEYNEKEPVVDPEVIDKMLEHAEKCLAH